MRLWMCGRAARKAAGEREENAEREGEVVKVIGGCGAGLAPAGMGLRVVGGWAMMMSVGRCLLV
jgi:hypothetical protein